MDTRRTKGNPRTPAVPTTDEIRAACGGADLAAAAWVLAVRARVGELARELGRMDHVLSHPDDAGAAAVLKTVLDAAAVGRLVALAYEAEDAAGELATPNLSLDVPDLAGACRAAAKRLGLGGAA